MALPTMAPSFDGVPAAIYNQGTEEWAMKNSALPQPKPRISRQDAHFSRSDPKERWFGALKKLQPQQIGPQFKYSELDEGEIRILRIQKGTEKDQLKATLFKRKLEDVRGCYEALSYSWGKERPREEILIRDLDARLPPHAINSDTWRWAMRAVSGAPFQIRRNLQQALIKLRRVNDPVDLWVDAICIDQSDRGHREKERQLAMMDQIYNNASNVCIWLGEDYTGAESAFKLIKDIMNFKTFDTMVHQNKESWAHLINILKAPWFSRRWIIQEVALSRSATVHYGKEVVHWDDFADAVSLVLEKIPTMRHEFKDEIFEDVESTSASILVQTLNNICYKSEDGDILARLLDLETLVSTLLGFQATSPRDTIYSVLSLANDPPMQREPWTKLHVEQLQENHRLDGGGQQGIWELITLRPNYKLSTRDAFIAFVTRSIHKTKCLDIICRHWAPKITDGGIFHEKVPLPSWISDISKAPFGHPESSLGRQNGENLVAYQPYDQRKRYNACGSHPAEISMALDPFVNPGSAVPPSKSVPPISEVFGDSLAAEVTTGVSPSERYGNIESVIESPNLDPTSQRLTVPLPLSRPKSQFIHKSQTTEDLKKKTEGGHHRRTKSQAVSKRGSMRIDSSDVERMYQLSGIMVVGGIVIGKITNQSDVMRGGIIPGDWVRRLGWDASSTDNRVPDIIWRLLVADRAPRGGKPPSWYQRACLHGLIDPRTSDSEGNLHSVSPADRKISEMTSDYFYRVEAVVWNRRLFEAKVDQDTKLDIAKPKPETLQALKILRQNQLFGLGPRDSEVGDKVCVLFGCTVPVILRPVKSEADNSMYQLVGEAYVHGVMDGEAVLSRELIEKMRTSFMLC
ncbi:hypothetical protein PT974_09818 [Cladobotryum mycophilum]|uniref:Heterokaryon incompatibility domain-containing protein n=1 Tax=Cladobotryum mycophilum TaxID=491253 RepID=A0ABR0SHP8_9HYPO